MGTGGEQILLCHSLETGQFIDYLGEIKRQEEERPSPNHNLTNLPHEPGTQSTSISAATSYLHDSIKCVLNWTDANPQTGTASPTDSKQSTYDPLAATVCGKGPDNVDYSIPDNAFPYTSRKPRHKTNYHPHTHQTESNHLNLDNNGRLLRSIIRERSPPHTLCHLKEALTNYYLENCVLNPGPSTPASFGISTIAYAGTNGISAVVTPELGGLHGNDSIMANTLSEPHPPTYQWNFLFFVIIFIIAGGLGNILVCLAIALDRKLQNVTNYFLLSLAIADLLVSLFVMPLGAIPTFLGYWPLGEHWCNIYVTCDVLACSASIWHMCFISLGRYLGIKNPLGSRHRATKRIVGIKIAVAWLMAMPVSSSIAILGSIDMQNIIPQQNVCTINNKQFFVYGSLVAFYIPMVIMVSTYALTVQLLRKKARFAAAHPESEIFRSLMSHRIGGTRYVKHSTGGFDSGGGGTEQVDVANCKPTPQYFKSKVKSISETDLGKSMRRPISVQRTANYEFGHRPPTHSKDQASPLTWNQPLLTATSEASPDTRSSEQKEMTKSVLDKKYRSKQTAICRSNKSNVRDVSPVQKHSSSSIANTTTDSHNKSVFASSTCDQGTQTSPKPLKRTADIRGHKLKLNIHNVASPYLNFNLRFPKNRKRASLSANAVANEQKATKVLGVVFFTFVLCWSPFFILNIVLVIYPRDDIPDHVIDVCLWLGYVSSTINPIIYTIFNRTFRAAFIRLLRCNCQRAGRPYRYRSVTETKGAASLCARSALPLAISLQGTGFFSSSAPNTRNTSTTVTDSEC